MSDEMKEKSAAGNEAAPCSNGQLYTIKPGDTLFLIAKRFSISLSSLRNANPQIADPNVIYPGQVVMIPALGTVPATRPAPRPRPVPGPFSDAECPGGQSYRVVSGDTMFNIAQRFGISLDALAQANPQIADPNRIYPGQEICIPGPGGQIPCSDGMNYTVIAGDTLFDIARRNGVMLSDLIAANPQITDPDRIFPGQVICIPAAAAASPPLELPAELPEPPFPMPAEPPVELPPPITPMPCPPYAPPMGQPPVMPMPSFPAPMPRPYPVERPLPCPAPQPPARRMPRPCPIERPMPPIQAPIHAPCHPVTGERPMMYPMPVYVVVPWDECPYRPKKGKKKHDRKRNRHCCH
jgi:spore coat assembly protein SafA